VPRRRLQRRDRPGATADRRGELTADPRGAQADLHRLDTGVGKPAGRAVHGPTVKRLSLELGGNAPFLVFDDADLDAAVEPA
jgi:succinate-semialdehyde dehydrogenase/glutarate-semialdehyde dehydrogenase